MAQTRQLCAFLVGDLLFGVDVADVKEVLQQQRMTRVPLAPPIVEGLINLRGQIVTTIDLRRRLGLPARPADAVAMNVVLTGPDGLVSLLVDAIVDVVEVEESWYEPAPATIQSETRRLLRGVYKVGDQLLLALEPTVAITVDAP